MTTTVAKRGARHLLLVTSCLSAVAGSAAAQSAGSQRGTSVEEIVVTAQKREERLQDVPLAVGVLDGAQAEARGAQGFDTLRGRIAGVQFFGLGTTAMQFAVRGVVTDRRAATPQTASLYLDEIPIGLGVRNPNLQQFDVERVEVLRGPQGTLFGAGAMAGALRTITKSPDLSAFGWGGGLEGSGTTDGGANGLIYGIVNAPIEQDVAGLRLVAYHRRNSGYIDNITRNDENANSENISGFRATGLAKLNEDLDVSVMAAFQDFRQADMDLANTAQAKYVQTVFVPQDTKARNHIFSATVNYDLGAAVLTSVTSYQDTSVLSRTDGARYPVILGAPAGRFPSTAIVSDYFQRGWTQEVRLTGGESGSRLKWLIGGYASQIQSGNIQTIDAAGFEAAVPAARPASSFGLPTDRLYSQNVDLDTRQVALFGDATLAVTSQLDVSAGVRWYDYKQDALIAYNGLLQGRSDSINTDAESSGFNPRVNVAFHPAEDKLIYAQVSKGFRIGGVNEPVPPSLCAADLAALGINSVPNTYEPDKLWNYEVGVKTSWFERRATLNATAFQIEWDNIQVTTALGCSYSIVLNSGKMRSRGAEIEGSLEPIPGLTLSGFVTYTDSEITEGSVGGAARVGQRAPFQPKWAYNVAVGYRRPVSDAMTAFIEVDYNHTGDRLTDLNPTSVNALVLPAYGVLSGRLGIERDSWQAFVFADNINNAYGLVDRGRRTASFPVYFSETPIRPRTIGVRVIKRLD